MARPLTIRRSHFKSSCIYPHMSSLYSKTLQKRVMEAACHQAHPSPLCLGVESLQGASAKPSPGTEVSEILSFMGSDSQAFVLAS